MTYNPKLGPTTPSTAAAKVFISSPDALAANALTAALGSDPRISVVTDPSEAEVIVWDLGIHPALDTSQATPRPDSSAQQSLLALVNDELAAAYALHCGALGVLQRSADPTALSAGVHAVRLGLCLLDARLAEHYLVLPNPNPSQVDVEALETLTAREREVLDLLALGLSNKAIAERLQVSLHTAKFHVNSILAKLGVESRSGAVAKALRRGLVAI